MTSSPERWAEQARYDLDTARAMLDNGRLLYVVFCCQQAVEKMLKGVIAHRSDELPPRLHNLMRLAKHAALEVEERRADFLRELSAYYIQTRYPEEIEAASREISQEMAHEMLVETEETMRWLSSMI